MATKIARYSDWPNTSRNVAGPSGEGRSSDTVASIVPRETATRDGLTGTPSSDLRISEDMITLRRERVHRILPDRLTTG
ncbi:hypothetical protein GCM10027259_46540 [Micromonospora palomenae]